MFQKTRFQIFKISGGEILEFIIKRILKEAGKPLTTREIQFETQKVTSFCPSSSVVGLNIPSIAGVIKGERSDENKGWIWWIED